jgi:hypothetical protein
MHRAVAELQVNYMNEAVNYMNEATGSCGAARDVRDTDSCSERA